MLKRLTTVNVWVQDQDEALAFYTEKLGLELRNDTTLPEMGNFRWLTVGVPGQKDVAIVLMAVPGPPVFDEETSSKLGPGRRALPAVPLRHRRRRRDVQRAQGPGRRVLTGADGPAVRAGRRFPRPVRESDAAGPAQRLAVHRVIPDGEIARSPRGTLTFEGEGYGSGVSFFLVYNQPGEGPDLHRHPY